MSKVLRGERPPEEAATDIGGSGRGRAVIPGAVYDAEQQAQRVLADAQAEADRIVTSARAEASRVHDDAATAGMREGREAAVATLAAAEAARARLLAEAESDIARLAVAIARKVLVGELALGDAAILRIVSQALASARLGRAVVVRVHPDDATGLSAAYPALLAAAGRSEGLVLRPDPGLARGDCVVESEIGTIDARIDTQLSAIEHALVTRGRPS